MKLVYLLFINEIMIKTLKSLSVYWDWVDYAVQEFVVYVFSIFISNFKISIAVSHYKNQFLRLCGLDLMFRIMHDI